MFVSNRSHLSNVLYGCTYATEDKMHQVGVWATESVDHSEGWVYIIALSTGSFGCPPRLCCSEYRRQDERFKMP